MKLKPLILVMSLLPAVALASSHREASFVAGQPTVDATDFYMLMSYEPGSGWLIQRSFNVLIPGFSALLPR